MEENKEKILQLEKTIKEFRKKETSLGPRYRLKRLRNIETLKRGSGGCSKRIKAMRYKSLSLAYISYLLELQDIVCNTVVCVFRFKFIAYI